MSQAVGCRLFNQRHAVQQKHENEHSIQGQRRCVAVLRCLAARECCLSPPCGLTLQSSGHPTAGGVGLFLYRQSRRWLPLTSNVRPLLNGRRFVSVARSVLPRALRCHLGLTPAVAAPSPTVHRVAAAAASCKRRASVACYAKAPQAQLPFEPLQSKSRYTNTASRLRSRFVREVSLASFTPSSAAAAHQRVTGPRHAPAA